LSLLLDTCTYIWLTNKPSQLSTKAANLLEASSEVYLSAISAYEVASKYAAGRLQLPSRPDRFIPQSRDDFGLLPLPLDEEAAVMLGKLPRLHQDPFDRMIICQALYHDLTIVTPDALIEQYPIKTVW
jgi:PIN domain nuclease of toxin-antitoxin system